jgi:hypothetical protein
MRKFFALLAVPLALLSCSKQYIIQGSSTVQSLDGKMLYLKALKDNQLVDIDSCEVIHGQFEFSGVWDSTMMVNLFMDDESIMPLVLEEGNVQIHIDHAEQLVTGTPLNDTLYAFIHEKSRIDNQIAELSHKESQMIMDGMDHDEILRILSEQAARLNQKNDSLVIGFISRNFDNVLGPGVFMILTSSFPYPIITPQIDSLMSISTPYFQNNSYVKEYMKLAKENMELMKERQEAGLGI